VSDAQCICDIDRLCFFFGFLQVFQSRTIGFEWNTMYSPQKNSCWLIEYRADEEDELNYDKKERKHWKYWTWGIWRLHDAVNPKVAHGLEDLLYDGTGCCNIDVNS